MKAKLLGCLAVLAITGCGFGASTDASANNSDNLNNGGAATDPAKGTAGGSGGPEACPVPCEAEQTAYKACLGGKSGKCDVEFDAVKQCLAKLPPPPPPPCDAEAIALKECAVKTPGTKCDDLSTALDACLAKQPPEPEESDPTGCTAPPPPPCGGGEKDKCEAILEEYKDCSLKTPDARCDDLLQQFDGCETAQQKLKAPDKP